METTRGVAAPRCLRTLLRLGRCAVLLSTIELWFSLTPALAGTKVTLGQRVAESRRVSMDVVDHTAWGQLLQAYVNEQGEVDYASWKTSSSALANLDAYLAELSRADPGRDATRQARLAFWINAYNGVTVRGILREYPTTSIRNHTATLFGYNIWKDLQLTVSDQAYSLDQMEHEILRKLHEPRIHFAIVCASIGCPRLRNEAYTATTLEVQLKDNAQHFFSLPRNFRYDVGSDTFYLSSILSWYGSDFGDRQSDQLRAIASHLNEGPARKAALAGKSRVEFLDYDWRLNEQPTQVNARRSP